MSSLQRSNPIFASGGFTTVGAAFALRAQGTPNWTGVRTGVGTATLTWASGEAVDAAESTVMVTCRTTLLTARVVGQTDTTLLTEATDQAVPAAAEAAVDFVVFRVV